MLPDEEGFLYPSVNESQCVACGLCEEVCPLLHSPDLPMSYADSIVSQSLDKSALNECTSGGFMDALYQYVLEIQGGWGAGVVFNAEHMPVHILTDSYERAKDFRNSKYAQSELGEVFQSIRELLLKEETVLFVGTPCQVAGLKSFLRKDYDNLITADLVCRSIPSPRLWKEYLQWQEQRYNSKVKQVMCRKKTYGYHSGTLEIVFENGRIYRGSNRVDYYMKSFHQNVCSRLSCYQCAFKTKHRCSDFTVFDAWKPQNVAMEPLTDNDMGFSNVLVHTKKGKQIVDALENMVSYKADPEKMFLYAGGMESRSINMPEARASFYRDLKVLGFEKTVRKHVSVTWKDWAIECFKPLWYGIKRKRPYISKEDKR